MKFVLLLILPLILFTYGIQNIQEVDGAIACSVTHLNEFIMKSASPRECERVNYWVHYECGRVEGLYLTDPRCQPPVGFPLERLATSGSFMEVTLDKTIYKMDDTIHVSGKAYTSVGLPEEKMRITILNSNGQEVLERFFKVNNLGDFGYDVLTGTSISLNDEDNYEMIITNFGKYGSQTVKKFTLSNDGLPIPVPVVVAPAPVQPSTSAPVSTPTPQDPEPFTTNWTMIVGFVIVIAVIGGTIFKKFMGSGGVPSRNYSYQESTSNSSQQESHTYSKEEPHDYSQDSDDPTYEDLRNNFERFEWEDAEDLTAKLFKAKGYTSTVGVLSKDGGRKRNGDFGIDVRANNGIVDIGIQVKHQVDDVHFDAVAKTLGVAQKFQKVIIISTKSGFSAQSWEHARNNPTVIELWDSEKFKEEITQYLIEQDNSDFEEELQSNLNYYEILGVSRNATQEEIKNRYREVSLKFHPDKEASSLSEEMMKQVNIAHETLKDIEKRKKYDSELDSV